MRYRRSVPTVALVWGLLASLVVTVPSAPVAAQSPVRDITFPVDPAHVDAVHWSDTWGAPRSGGRSHIGVDIMGPKMTPLVAAANGTVTWFRHGVKGNNLEITDAEGWSYHYVHINNDTPGTDDGSNLIEHAFAPGIQNGAVVRAGQIVAYLGDSGNAESTAPHLHFEIIAPDGTPINPTASVDAARARVSVPSVPAELLGPFGDVIGLSSRIFTTLNGRAPSTVESTIIAQQVMAEGLSSAIGPHVDASSPAASIDRLYVAYFLRRPDFEGLRYWIDEQGAGVGLSAIADSFADSDEFRARYSSLDFGAFLDRLYIDVLGRTPDEQGKAYWLDELQRGRVTKGSIVVFFTEGEELVSVTSHRSEIVALTALFDRTEPTDAAIVRWQSERNSASLVDLIETWFVQR